MNIRIPPDVFNQICIIPMILVMVFTVIYLVSAVVEWSHTAYAITNMRVLTQYGMFSTKLASVKFDKIQNTSVLQPFLEKMIGCGTVLFATSGLMGGIDTKQASKMMVSGGAVVWRAVPEPMRLHRYVQEIMDNALRVQKINEFKDMARVMESEHAAMPSEKSARNGIHPKGYVSVEEKLRKLKSLRDEGILTEEEYENKKRELLTEL